MHVAAQPRITVADAHPRYVACRPLRNLSFKANEAGSWTYSHVLPGRITRVRNQRDSDIRPALMIVHLSENLMEGR